MLKININQTLGTDRAKQCLLPKPKEDYNKFLNKKGSKIKRNKNNTKKIIDKNRLLGVDRIKITIPYLKPEREYINHFKEIDFIEIGDDKYLKIMQYNKCLPYGSMILKTLYQVAFKDKKIKKTLHIDINIPKYVYGNNVFESTYGDLEYVINDLEALLLRNKIISRRLDLKNTQVSYLEIGRNIIVCNPREFIYKVLQHTRCWNGNKILLTKYRTNLGYGCQIQNANRQLSYYDKNLEILSNSPDNAILPLLNEKGIKIVRCEQKLNNPQEIRRVFKQDISLFDLLYTDISSSVLYDIWEKQKLNTNIYDLSKVNVKDIFDYIKDTKLGNKMKKGLINFISDLSHQISFDEAYKRLKKEFSINYRNKVLGKYEEIMGYFKVPTFSFIETINENIYRKGLIQEHFK